MYITITPQKLGTHFNQSSRDFVNYLEKENEERTLENFEYFFNQTENAIKPDRVMAEIDFNNLKRSFWSKIDKMLSNRNINLELVIIILTIR